MYYTNSFEGFMLVVNRSFTSELFINVKIQGFFQNFLNKGFFFLNCLIQKFFKFLGKQGNPVSNRLTLE